MLNSYPKAVVSAMENWIERFLWFHVSETVVVVIIRLALLNLNLSVPFIHLQKIQEVSQEEKEEVKSQ